MGHCVYVVHGQNQIKSGITFTKAKLIQGDRERKKKRAGEANKIKSSSTSLLSMPCLDPLLNS